MNARDAFDRVSGGGGSSDEDGSTDDRTRSSTGGSSTGRVGGASQSPTRAPPSRTVTGSSRVGVSETAPAGAGATTGFNDDPDARDAGDSGLRETVSSGVERVRSGVNSVSDTLPGGTGTAFAAGVGLAAVPEPTPATEVSGAAIAGGAALVGGGVLASRALRERGGELGIGERVTNELDTGQSRRDVTEIGVSTGTSAEFEAPSSPEPVGTEIGVPQRAPGSSAGEVPVARTGQQVGVGQQPAREIGDERTTITRDDLEGFERTDELDEAERQRQIREELERRQEFVRDDSPTRDGTRDPVRFPADEAATGTAPGLAEQLEPDFDVGREPAFGTAFGAGSGTDRFVGGFETDEVAGGAGGFAGGAIDRTAIDTLGGQPTGTRPEPGRETGGGTDTTGVTDTGTDTGGVTDTETTTQLAAEAAVGSQTATPTQTDVFAEPTAFEEVFVEPVEAGFGSGSGTPTRDRPRRPVDEFERDDDAIAFDTDVDDDRFDTGFLSAEDALGGFGR